MVARALVAAVALASVPALASSPGQPLDCSDWVMLEPGITCSTVEPAPDVPYSVGLSSRTAANDGFQFLVVRNLQLPDAGCSGGAEVARFRTRVVVVRSPEVRTVAFVDDRLGDFATCQADRITPCCDSSLGSPQSYLLFDAVNGSLDVHLTRTSPSIPFPGHTWIARFTGFSRLFDIVQTYAPGASEFGFRVPAHPFGLPAADHFDTYYGPLANPIDLSQAQPLQCDYPESPPAPCDYLTVADPLPNPAVGTGRYYLTTVTHAGETRAGRRAVNGMLHGRDPSRLSRCSPSSR